MSSARDALRRRKRQQQDIEPRKQVINWIGKDWTSLRRGRAERCQAVGEAVQISAMGRLRGILATIAGLWCAVGLTQRDQKIIAGRGGGACVEPGEKCLKNKEIDKNRGLRHGFTVIFSCSTYHGGTMTHVLVGRKWRGLHRSQAASRNAGAMWLRAGGPAEPSHSADSHVLRVGRRPPIVPVMFDRFRSIRMRIWLAAFYAVAMILVASAHRPVELSRAKLTLAEAYALPGGLENPLCLPGQGETGDHDHAGTPCDACLITAAPGLGAAPAPELMLPLRSMTAFVSAVFEARASLARYAPSSRGPPSNTDLA